MMRYENMVPGIFLARPNRFIAHVEIEGQEQIVHVKNTGRCRELLPAGAKVWCQHWDNPSRKTKYDLILVQKGERLICMDSQAPNAAAKEWLLNGGLGQIEELKGEYTHGDSRFDFSFVKYLHPNDATDPAFGNALREARRQGVEVLAVECAVTRNSMAITAPVEVKL